MNLKFPVPHIKMFLAGAGLLLAAGCGLFSPPVAGGLVKTVNGGADWQFSNSITSSSTGASLSQSNMAKLGFDPTNHETVYAGSYSDGLYKSADSGASWSRVLSRIGVYDFAVSPVDNKTIYVAGIYNNQGKVLKTTDGGASWQEIYNESSSNLAVRAMDINPAVPTQLIIGTASGNLIKSADGGLSWQLVNNFNDQINRVFWRSNGIYVLLKTKGFFRGDSSGTNFQELTASITKAATLDYVYNGQLSYNQAYVDPIAASLLYITDSRGLYKSVDGGMTWNDTLLPTKTNNTGVRAIAVAPSSSNIVFASVGSVIYKSTNGGQTWQTQNIVTGGFVNYVLIDPQLPQVDYAGIYVPSQ